MSTRIGTLAVLAVLATAPTALAAPATVNLRVEGSTQTLFDDPITTDGHDVTTSAGGTHKCDGTNGGVNPSPGPSATAALDDGAKKNGFTWDGTYDSGYDDFFITRIGPDTNTGGPAFQPYWGFFVNWVAADKGGCQTRVSQGDQVQFLYSNFGQPLLELSAPAKATTGQAFGVNVKQHDGAGNSAPAAGAGVAGGTTGADGSATISFDSAGVKTFKATRSDAVRSNAVEVCVADAGSSACDDVQAGAPAGGGPIAGDSVAPNAKISGLVNGRRYRRGPRLLRGEASDNVGLFQVYLRLRMIGRGGCRWFSTKRETFTKPGTCENARFGRLGTDTEWDYLLPRRLGRGRYILEAKAIDRAFNGSVDRVKFTVLG